MRALLGKYEGTDKNLFVKELKNMIDSMENLMEIAAWNSTDSIDASTDDANNSEDEEYSLN